MLDRVVGTYVEALNIVHWCHVEYAYESIEMALLDSEIIRSNLAVRVSGYAVNFVKLTAERQRDVLDRTFHENA